MRNVEGRPKIDAQIGNKNNCWPPRLISAQIVSTRIYDCHENFKENWGKGGHGYAMIFGVKVTEYELADLMISPYN